MGKKNKAFLKINHGSKSLGKIIVKLDFDRCPKTSTNFMALCKGDHGISTKFRKPLHYEGCIFHRVIKNFMVQSGDFGNRNGTGGESIYGGTFDDEDLSVNPNEPFMLCMANKGPDTNGSQFFINTIPVKHLDGKHVVFGEVIQGQDVILKMEKVEVDANYKPLVDVVIKECGGGKSKKVNKKKDKKKKTKEEAKGKIETELADPIENQYFSTVRPEEIPEDNGNRFLNDRSHKDKIRNVHVNKDSVFHPRRMDTAGNVVKGHGIMRYRASSLSRSRSRTPPHWRKRRVNQTQVNKNNQKSETEKSVKGEDDLKKINYDHSMKRNSQTRRHKTFFNRSRSRSKDNYNSKRMRLSQKNYSRNRNREESMNRKMVRNKNKDDKSDIHFGNDEKRNNEYDKHKSASIADLHEYEYRNREMNKNKLKEEYKSGEKNRHEDKHRHIEENRYEDQYSENEKKGKHRDREKDKHENQNDKKEKDTVENEHSASEKDNKPEGNHRIQHKQEYRYREKDNHESKHGEREKDRYEDKNKDSERDRHEAKHRAEYRDTKKDKNEDEYGEKDRYVYRNREGDRYSSLNRHTKKYQKTNDKHDSMDTEIYKDYITSPNNKRMNNSKEDTSKHKYSCDQNKNSPHNKKREYSNCSNESLDVKKETISIQKVKRRFTRFTDIEKNENILLSDTENNVDEIPLPPEGIKLL